MRGGRTDGNHGKIRDALRMAVWPVYDTSHIGGGFPDLMTRSRTGSVLFLEIKDGRLPPSRRVLTPAELKFQALWGKNYVVVTSVEEAFRAVGYDVRTPAPLPPVPPRAPKPSP